MVKCHGFTTDDNDEDHIVFEWIDKEELEQFLPGMTLQDRMTILTAVAKAVRHLHRHGIVHNDIALRNILVCRTRGPIALEHIKICGKRIALYARKRFALLSALIMFMNSSLCRSWVCVSNK